MAELRWSNIAVKDLEDICSYIEQDSEEYARIFAQKVFDLIETIVTFPFAGRIVPEMKNEMIREKIITNYRIIYRINEEKIEIARIIHNARDFKNLR